MSTQAAQNAVATAQIIGDRENQEDALATHVLEATFGERKGEQLLLLADGMGGHVGGEVASRLVVERFAEAYIYSQATTPDALRNSLDSANEQLADAVAETPALKGMATTLVGCVIRENRMYWISVGDSPLWVFHDGALQRINADHSMVPVLDDMVRTGVLDEAEARVDYRRNLLRSGIVGKAIELVDLCEAPRLLETDDILLLASDGIETLTNDQLIHALGNSAGERLPMMASNLMSRIEAADRPGQDNASVILYRH